MPPLPPRFLDRPLAHRALHDLTQGRPENSRDAIRAAVAAGYGIEVDVQPSQDGQAMVFHDYDLGRLTGRTGAIATHTAAALGAIPLTGGPDGIPTLAEVLRLVDGRVPLVIEVKDQDGGMGPNVGLLEGAVANTIQGYVGPLALMSFNPHSVAALAERARAIPRGLVTDPFDAQDWPLVPDARRKTLRNIPDFARVGASFVSHNVADLAAPAITTLKQQGVPILCWTVRSPEVEAQARQVADQITFEGYAPTA